MDKSEGAFPARSQPFSYTYSTPFAYTLVAGYIPDSSPSAAGSKDALSLFLEESCSNMRPAEERNN